MSQARKRERVLPSTKSSSRVLKFAKEWGFEVLVCAGVLYLLYVFGPSIFGAIFR